MIDSKIILAQNLLKQKSVDFTHEKLSTTSANFFIHLPKNVNIEYLIYIWTILDDLDFRTFNGCTTKVDVYQEKNIGVVKIFVEEKKSSFYGLPPARKTTPTTTDTSKNYVSKDPVKEYGISELEARLSMKNLTPSKLEGIELYQIEEFIESSYYGYNGPFFTDEGLEDSIYFDIVQPVESGTNTTDYSNTVKIIINKFSRDVFIVTEVKKFKNISHTSFFRCHSMDQLEYLFYGIGFFID